MNIRYRVTLTADERRQLQTLVSGGKGAVRKIKRAQILLAADAKSGDEMIALNIGVGTSTVYRTKQRFVEDGLERALSEAPRPGPPRKLSASDEALLVAVACSSPPSGRARWTLELLAGEMVRLTAHETLSGDTVGRRLAEMDLKPWQEKMWCIPAVSAKTGAPGTAYYADAHPDSDDPVLSLRAWAVEVHAVRQTSYPLRLTGARARLGRSCIVRHASSTASRRPMRLTTRTTRRCRRKNGSTCCWI